MFSFLHQKTYTVRKKENIYVMQEATVILLHTYRTSWDKEKYCTFYSSISKHYIKQWKTSEKKNHMKT